MLTNVEFYICPDGSINVQRKDGPLSVYDHNCRDILEEVKCPLRGECVFEGTICKAKMKTVLSDREMEVAKRLGRDMSKTEIAEDLRISICTVARHIANIKSRLKLAHSNQIVAWFSRQDIN